MRERKSFFLRHTFCVAKVFFDALFDARNDGLQPLAAPSRVRERVQKVKQLLWVSFVVKRTIFGLSKLWVNFVDLLDLTFTD